MGNRLGSLVSSKLVFTLLLLGVGAIWTYQLQTEASFGGFSPNDCEQHTLYTQKTFDGLNQGQLPLDLWTDHCCLGSPIFRSYQYLPHLVAAFWMKLTGFNASHAVHFLLVFFWLLQIPCFYVAARMISSNQSQAVLVAILSPLISSVGLGGHGLRTYLFYGIGMYAQISAPPFLILSLALSLQLNGWVKNLEKAAWRKSLMLGVLLALAFLFHHYVGYLGVLAFGVLAILGALLRFLPWRIMLSQGAMVAGLFLLSVAHQLKSLIEDSPLAFQNTWSRPELWNGLGLSNVLSAAIHGELYDYQRAEMMGVLLAVALVGILARKSARAWKGLAVLFMLGLILLSGRESFSLLMKLPLFSFFQPERSLVLIHVCTIFLAGHGLWLLFHLVSTHFAGEKLRQLTLIAFGALVVGMVHYRELEVVKTSRDKILQQQTMDERIDPELTKALGSLEDRSRLWTNRNWMVKWAEVPFQSFLAEMGYAHISISEHSMIYGTETIHSFNPLRREHYDIFRVGKVFLPKWFQSVDFLTPVYQTSAFNLFQAPNRGLWDVVTLGPTKFVKTPNEFMNEIDRWLSHPGDARVPPVIMPTTLAERWPESVPHPEGGFMPNGQVIANEEFRNQKSSAILEAGDAGQFALFRISYHPRWAILRNGQRVSPQWAAPGYVTFPLEAGRNEITIEFKKDPIREGLFYLGWTGWFASVLLLVGMRLKETVELSGRKLLQEALPTCAGC